MPKVLIIDDIDNTRTTIREMLQRGGHEVMEACNGREGLKIIEKNAPDIVVTDIIMPEMEGIETIRCLRKNKPQLPVLAITGSIDTPYLETALKFGAVSGLYKPFKQAELLSAIDLALKKK